ncbi:MAG: hypothetical protein M3268_04100, partial [Acidobacteriota bacterium]|nr:hypothetical protein [Acidobacteriota bacterium]
MTFDWQTAVVILIVLAAALYVGRMALARVRSMRGRGAASLPDCCSGCDSKEPKRSDAPEPSRVALLNLRALVRHVAR